MSIIWSSTVNKSGTRTPVHENNVEYVAVQVTSALMKVFGTQPNDWSDQVWDEYIDPFIDQYIRSFFVFDGLVTRKDLDEEIETKIKMMEQPYTGQDFSDYNEEG